MITEPDSLGPAGQGAPSQGGRLKFLFLVLCGLLLVSHVANAQGFLVTRVYDGDTLRLEDGRILRLYGLDTPEMGKKGKAAQYFARAAKKILSRLVLHKRVEVVEAGKGRDRYGRTLAVLVLPDQRVVNEVLLRVGAAFYFPHPDKKNRFVNHKRFLFAQRQALEDGRGFWPEIFSLPTGAVYGNRRSRRFHLPVCRYAKSLSSKNRRIFSSLKDAFYAGFAPCRYCTPWPGEKKAL